MIKFEINDAPRNSIILELDGNLKIIDIKQKIKSKYKEYSDLNPEDYLLLIDGFFNL